MNSKTTYFFTRQQLRTTLYRFFIIAQCETGCNTSKTLSKRYMDQWMDVFARPYASPMPKYAPISPDASGTNGNTPHTFVSSDVSTPHTHVSITMDELEGILQLLRSKVDLKEVLRMVDRCTTHISEVDLGFLNKIIAEGDKRSIFSIKFVNEPDVEVKNGM